MKWAVEGLSGLSEYSIYVFWGPQQYVEMVGKQANYQKMWKNNWNIISKHTDEQSLATVFEQKKFFGNAS